MVVAGTMATESLKHQQRALGKIDSIQQNSDIKDLLFNLANQSGTSCKDRLGIPVGSVFTPATNEFPLDPSQFQLGGVKSQIDRIFLSQPSLLRSVGSFVEYSAQLNVQQSTTRGAALAPVTLGLINFTVDPAGTIVSCSWDQSSITPADICSGTQGTITTGNSCNFQPETPVDTNCPNKTALINGNCVPAGVNCFNQALGNKFDTNIFNCQSLPNTVAIRYPAGYTPPNAPAQQNPNPNAPALVAPTTCTCGNSIIQVNSNQLCIMAWSRDEGFGNSDDMWEAKRCNSAGELEPNTPEQFVFEEQGNNTTYGWRVGTCNYYGETKSSGGKLFVTGSCF